MTCAARQPALRARFAVNQRVSIAGIYFRDGVRRGGVVRGFSADGRSMRVQVDGRRSVAKFHPAYVRPEE
jgi:hypothetical protein